MKIINLLNKIANGEEIPQKIKFDNKEYENEPCYMLYEATGDRNELQFKSFLNDEVEILEEEKKIPERVLNAEVFDVPKLNNMELSNIALTNKEDIKIIKDTLNKVLDYLKSKGE